MSEKQHDKAGSKEKAGEIKPLILAALLIGAIAAPLGWFLGGQIGNEIPSSPETSHMEKETTAQTSNSALIALTPIVTTLREPENIWVRMEISLVMKDQQLLGPESQAEISSDFVALLRQMTLAQIKGPTGLMNLREDLLDRARIRSGGQVSALLISHLVIE